MTTHILAGALIRPLPGKAHDCEPPPPAGSHEGSKAFARRARPEKVKAAPAGRGFL